MLDAIDRLNWLRSQVDRLWSRESTAPPAAYPALNLLEDAENFYAEAELPGFRIEDFELSLVGTALAIRGKRETPSGDWTVHRQERPSGEFSRTITFPAQIDADGVQAALKEGVLRVTLPKAPTAKPRRIEVKALGHKE